MDEAAVKYPEKTALTDEYRNLTYSELRKEAMRIGSYIIKEAEDENPVIIYMKKSAGCICAFMGVLYSGRAYVPVAYDMPYARLKKISENLKPSLIITDADRAEFLKESGYEGKIALYSDAAESEIDAEAVNRTTAGVIDTDPIYIMYTSGSTGEPKGVTVPHRGVIDYVTWTTETFGLTKDDIFGNQAPFYFDNSIFDIYGCLMTGAEMVIIPEALFNFQNKLPEYVAEKEITVIFWVPTVLINVANSGALGTCRMEKLKKVLFCGEVMPNTQLNIWRENYPSVMYANLYGPTEITDVCTYYIVDRPFKNSDPLPIGKACRNMRTLIITEDGRKAEVGEAGELCIIGTGVSLGYWNNSAVSDKNFIQNPFNKNYFERIYKTGDLAYENEEGLIIYVGRMDSQIKINGNRVELGEIENAAMCVEGVLGACALLDKEKNKIALFIESESEFKLRIINNELRQYIPKYMLPGELFIMEKFPHTPNDKIDRVKLKKILAGEEN